jgi:peptide-methionine (S)-S-oxide reductase
LKATFAAGCFWGVEAAFRTVPGVTRTRVGFTGGHTTTPSYREVCGHETGHAEAVEVEFDPRRVSYENLVGVFWSIHNPTAANRGPVSQYRSEVFVHGEDQRRQAEASKESAQSGFAAPILTEITPAPEFWEAEDYDQQYYEKHGMAASCHTVAATRSAGGRWPTG